VPERESFFAITSNRLSRLFAVSLTNLTTCSGKVEEIHATYLYKAVTARNDNSGPAEAMLR